MTAVFVHGNPGSAAVRDPLLAVLDRTDVRRLSPPGFGAPVPPRFDCTVTAYRDWLIHELATLGEPVDLAGHDVGGSAVVGVAMSRPDLLRTWAGDSVGLFDPDYGWHDLALLWQTPRPGHPRHRRHLRRFRAAVPPVRGPRGCPRRVPGRPGALLDGADPLRSARALTSFWTEAQVTRKHL